jgi:hypothetical protein
MSRKVARRRRQGKPAPVAAAQRRQQRRKLRAAVAARIAQVVQETVQQALADEVTALLGRAPYLLRAPLVGLRADSANAFGFHRAEAPAGPRMSAGAMRPLLRPTIPPSAYGWTAALAPQPALLHTVRRRAERLPLRCCSCMGTAPLGCRSQFKHRPGP